MSTPPAPKANVRPRTRRLAALAVAVLSTTVLTACTSSADSQASSPTSSTGCTVPSDYDSVPAQKLSGTAPGPARVLAFAIDGRTKLPPLPPGRDPIPLPPAAEPNAAPAKEGNTVWDANGCELCHGFKAVDGLGSVPDLRRIPAPHYDVFSQIIRGGLFKATGMPVFADSIREEDLAALKAYLIGEAWKGYRAEQASKPQP